MSDASSRRPGSTWFPHSNLGNGTWSLRRRTAALLALLLGLFSLGYTLGAPHAAAETSTTARISVNANTPAVSASGESVTLTGTITNTGSTTIEHPVVHVAIGSKLLDTRTTAERWMSGKVEVPLKEVASDNSAAALSAGSSASFAVDVPGKKLKVAYGLASLPLTVTLADGDSSAASAIRGMTRSTLQVQNGPVQSPLQLTVVIPLTLPADPDLFGPTGATRAAAWERAVGPDSDVQRTLDAFQGQPVTFAVDPALIDPPAAADDNVPSPTASASAGSSSGSGTSGGSDSGGSDSTDSSGSDSGTPDPTSTASGGDSSADGSSTDGSTDPSTSGGDTSDGASGGATDGTTDGSGTPSSSESSTNPPSSPQGKIDASVEDLTDRLTSLGDGQSVWWLPSDDPDLTALRKLGEPAQKLVTRDFSRALPGSVKSLGDTRLVWPSGDLAGSAVTSYTKQFAQRSKSSAIALLPDRAVGSSQDATTTHRVTGTSGVLTYDEQLSGIFSESTTSPGTQTSRLLSQLMALYLQSPGTARSRTLVAPRTGGANPVQLAAQVNALSEAGWVRLRTGKKTAAALGSAPRTSLLKMPRKGNAPKVPGAAVTAPELADLSKSRSRLAALQSVLVGGEEVVPARKRALDIIGSTRWRGASTKLAAVAGRNTDAVSAMLRKLSIRSSTINFFADSGDISVTVSNELNRPVHDLQLYLRPTKYLVRVTDPVQKVDIDAESRATAQFHIEAVGAGTVPLESTLSAPNGIPLTDADSPSQVKINVHPTSGWIMWVLGVLAGLILVIGLWRAVRRGPRTASEPSATDTPTPNDAIVDAGQKPHHQTVDDEDESTDRDD